MNKRLLPMLLSVSASCVAAITLAADNVNGPVCRLLLDAMSKSVRGPVHTYTTIGNLSDGTAPREIESITIGEVAYSKIRGEWKVSKTMPLVEGFIEQMTLQREAFHCEQERDEPFEGEAAAVYRMRLGEGNRIVEGRTWVSKTRGLMIHTNVTITVNRHVTHASVRYDYTNVEAPAGAR